MKTKRFLALSAAFAAALALPFGTTAKAGDTPGVAPVQGQTTSELVIRIEGLPSLEGDVLVGVFDTEDAFESEMAVAGETVPVTSTEAEIVFDDLPAGDYALKVFDDEDSDGKLDTDFLGIPSEAYGFSNNASDPFSAPEWEEARFSVTGGRVVHTISVG